VNLLDLQLLSDGDSPEKSVEDDWRMAGTEKSPEAHPFISQLLIYVAVLSAGCLSGCQMNDKVG